MPDYLVKIQEEFKYKTVGIPAPYIGSIPGGSIVIFDEKNLEYVLTKNFENYEKGKNVRDILGDFLGNGIFASDGKQWKLHRKVASRMFSRALLRTGTEMALRNCKEVTRYIDEKIEKGESFDLAKLFFNFTMDTFVEIAFGKNLGSLRKPHPFATSFDVVQNLSEKRMRNPIWKMLRYVRFFVLIFWGGEFTFTHLLNPSCYFRYPERRRA